VRLSVLLIFLIAPYLSAGEIVSASASAGCSPIDGGDGERVVSSQDGAGSASALASITAVNCGNFASASVAGLDFSVFINGGDSFDYYIDGLASIHGAAEYVITGGVGYALAYIDYALSGQSPDNQASAYPNVGWFVDQSGDIVGMGPFQFKFGVPFLLSIDAYASCPLFNCVPPPSLQGGFGGLDRVTTLDGSTTLNATLTEFNGPLPEVPEPSYASIILLVLGAIGFVARRRGKGFRNLPA
jgi:PEP-CTERM motif